MVGGEKVRVNHRDEERRAVLAERLGDDVVQLLEERIDRRMPALRAAEALMIERLQVIAAIRALADVLIESRHADGARQWPR